MGKFIVDANIFFAALLKPSANNFFLLTTYAKHFITTEFVFVELEKYDTLLTKYNPQRRTALMIFINSGLQIIPLQNISNEIAFLESTMQTIDPKDIQYVALAYKKQLPLWTHDKALYTAELPIQCVNTEFVINTFHI